MAMYRLSVDVVRRSRGQSVVACAAYRAGEKLNDERTGEVYDYTKKQDVAFQEILAPEGAPTWMRDRQTLWNKVELTEKRKDAQLAREVQLTLPRELTLSQNIDLTLEFVKDRYVSLGMVADVNIHIPKASDGEQQPHAHVLLTMREIKNDGFGLKARGWNQKCELENWREAWGEYANKHLAMNGHDVRIDHRTLAEQGIDLEPQKKIGTSASYHQRMAAYKDHQEIAGRNGEKLLANPDIVLDVLTRQQSTFTHQDIARIVNRYTANAEQFQVVYEKVKASSELVFLDTDDKQRERFTTKDMLKLETEMMGNAVALSERHDHVIDNDSIPTVALKHGLSAEQNKVLDHIVGSGDLANVVGYAGTGKSRMLGAAKEVWEQAGYRVLGASLSGIAAENLESSSGIESRTLASRMYAWDAGREQLTSKDILVVDEAGMLGSQQLGQVVEEANKHGAKVVLVGDPEQLQAIQAGAAFRAIAEHIQPVELVEIWRQNEDWQKEATVQFATKQTGAALAQYAKHDCVHDFDTQLQAQGALIDAWNDARISNPDKSQIMLAYTRVDAADLNDMARSLRQSLGELGEDHVISTAEGERVFAERDRVYFLKNNKDLGVRNGTLGTITGINDGKTGKELVVQLDKEHSGQPVTVRVNLDEYNHLNHGYAATTHKAQGVTVDRTYLLASKYVDRHAAYVAMTRHRDGAEIFWSKEAFPNHDAMVNTLGRERLKDTTQDYVSDEYSKASFAAYRGMDTLWNNFWEKHGSQWLEKIQGTIHSLADSSKNLIDSMKDQVSKAIGINQENTKDAWLEEMRAWVDVSFGKDEYRPSGEKSKEGRGHDVEMQNVNPATSDNKGTPLSDEERYQKIVKDSETWSTKSKLDRSFNQDENKLPPIKDTQKAFDKEIEF